MNAVPLTSHRTSGAWRGASSPIGRASRTARRRAWVVTVLLALLAFLAGPVPAANAATGPPFGQFDNAVAVPGGILLWGWVIDRDTVNATYVWVTVDGVGRHILANQSRPDVGAAYPAFGPDHGFRATLPTTRGTHRVCVTGHNVGAGSHTSFGCRNVNAIAPGSPVGNFERAVGVVDGIDIQGWVIDPDITDPTYAWVTVDGAGRHILANDTRADVGAVFPGYGPTHGFRSTVPATPGLHTVCVTGHNVGAGGHTNLGCKIVVVGSAQCPPFGSTGPQGSGGSGLEPSSIYGSTMRVGKQPCFDRFVLEFTGTGDVPGWTAFGTRRLLIPESEFYIPGGELVSPPLAGTWFIDVRFGAWDSGEPLDQPALSPKRIVTSGFTAIKEARTLGGLEGISDIAIGVDNPRPYRVTWLEGPHRLVVDVFTGLP